MRDWLRGIAIRLLAVFSALAAISCWAEDRQWVLEYDDGVVRAYTAETPGSRLKTIRLTARVQRPYDQLIAVHQQFDQMPEWAFGLREVESVERLSDHEYIAHMLYDAPWPVKDRDLFLRNVITTSGSRTRMDFHSVDGLADMPGYHRVGVVRGHWIFTQEPDGWVSIDYELFSDPGGNVPTWLINLSAIDVPLKTVKGMIDYVFGP